MEYVVGVDLGSTTTKAVMLEESGRIVGRGITNSRSNYDVACQVALSEACINARFVLADGALAEAGMDDAVRADLLTRLERRFRMQQYIGQLELLRRTMAPFIPAGSLLEPSADAIIQEMIGEAPVLFEPGAERKSDFFRDLAGGRYLELAEAEARERGACFEELAGLFDKAIIVVENSPQQDDAIMADINAALAAIDGGERAVLDTVAEAIAHPLVQIGSVGTGYGRQRLPFPKKQVRSEILCHGLGAHAMFPGTRTVLDIGGQDTKAIQVDERGIVTSFQMNDRCAAGCGRYLGYIADEMNLGVHQLGPIAEQAKRTVRISSTCTVFAGAELRERLSLGEEREDILAGLHRAIILRAMSLLARSGGIKDEFTFTGGVAKNPAATKALANLVAENYGEMTINISPDSIYTGALGAALFALRDLSCPVPTGE